MEIGKSLEIADGDDVCILATGTVLKEALNAAEILHEKGISANVVSFYSAKPLDTERLETVFSQFPLVATIEEHSEIGGIGAAVSEWLVQHCVDVNKFLPIALPDKILHESGSQNYARGQFGLTAAAIAERLLKRLERR